MERHVEFVEYTGKWPALCHGVLTLKINGKEIKFGHEYGDFDYELNKFKNDNYNSFWTSGGKCSLFQCSDSEDWTEEVISGRWEIDIDEIPDEYKGYAEEIEEVFNDNVRWGCCGGCI